MRLIEQVSRMLAAIVARKNAGQHAEAAVEIDKSCRETLGWPLELVRFSTPEALWDFLQQGGGLCYGRAVLLAELLLQDAELRKAAGHEAEALRSQVRARFLLEKSVDSLSREEGAIYRAKLEALDCEVKEAEAG